APFVAAASPQLLGLDSFTELPRPRDLAKTFDTIDYAKWNAFRDSEDSRFVNLVLPRVLARLPYGSQTRPIDEFDYEEAPVDKAGILRPMPHDDYCWMNAAFAMGARLTDAFAKTGWGPAIRGRENGGTFENLPLHVYTADDGDRDAQCPTEVPITDRRDNE